jgi:DNA-directed RNA polymerase subunit L
MKGDGQTQEEIEFEKRNFYLLDAQREYVENSFDFKLKSIGIYTNKRLVYTACVALIDKFTKFIETIDGDSVPINIGETTMENSYDIVLEGEDYTMGKLLEHILYTKYFEKEKQLSYCGFKKFHPHSDDSIIRLSYHQNVDKNHIRGHLKACSNDIIDVYKKIQKMFT